MYLDILSYLDILFVSHGFGWMNMRYEVAWCYEHKDADEQRGDVQCHDEKPVELYWHGTHIVSLCIQLHDARVSLQGENAQSDEVAKQHTLADDENGKPKEGVADGLVAGS